MVFGTRTWTTTSWTVERLGELHSAFMELLMDTSDEGVQQPKLLSDILADLKLEDDILLRNDGRVNWIDPESGSRASPSI